MREFRKIVSGLLAVCLLVSMLPRYAWATEPEPTEPPESVASTAPTAPAPTAPPETEPPESLEPEEPEPEPTEPPETEPIGSGTPDGTPPVLNSITLSATTVTAPGSVEVIVDASDDVSGAYDAEMYLRCAETGKELRVYARGTYYDEETKKDVAYADEKLHGMLEIDQYVESGSFFVEYVSLRDVAGNHATYSNSPKEGIRDLPKQVKELWLKIFNAIPDVTTSVSKSDFVDVVEKATDNAYIAADYSGDATMPKEAFDAIKGTDKTIDLISEGITWRFEGSDITEEIKDIDLKVDIQKVEEDSSASGDAIEDNLKGNPGVVMKFPENGTLPGKATIQVKVDYAMRQYLGSSEGLSVYYYNNQTGELELIASGLKVINDTYVEFPITHCSYYVLAPTLNNDSTNDNSGTCGDNLTWEFDEETRVLTVKGTGPMYEYADGYVDGKTTPPWAEGDRDRIKQVVIEEGVTTISDAAFCGFEKIQSVSIPSTVESIGGIAFEYCYSLERVVLPDHITSIGVSAFLDCRQLSSVVVGREIETIGGFAFGGCSSLKTITFNGDAPSFGSNPNDVFCDVTATVYYPASNTTWTSDVMQNYGGTLTWKPYGNHIVASGTCGDNLTWTLDDEGTLTISGTGAMEDYPSVSSDGILEDIAPWYYHEVKKAVLSEGITYIGASAFMDQARMTAVEIPKSVTSIGTRAFCGCSSLTGVTLPETVTDIGVSAFLACEKLSSINIPANITVINDFAFAHCSRLSDVTIPAGVTRLGDNAFLYSGLRRISIPEKVTSIGGSAFAGCSNLAEIIFTGNAPKISDGAFVDVRATAYYPANDSTWTNKVMQSYGGNIQWVVQQDLKELYLFYNYHQPIAVGETVRIDISCSPRGASVDPVYSTSSRSEIVEKDATGVVIKALSAGITTISVTDTITGKKDEVSIRIVEPVKIGAPCSETYDSTNPRSGDPYSFTPKKTGQYVFSLENFDDPTLETYIDVTKYTENSPGSSWLPIEWELSARNSFRRVYTLEAGESYLIRLMHMGLGLQSGAVFRVSEVVPVTGIDIPEEEKTVWFCDANSGLNVTANVQPINAVGEIEWSSSDPSVMVIEGIGGATTYIRVNKPGTAVITATCGNYSDSVTVTAKEPPVLTLNTPVTDVCQLGEMKVYSFTAPEDGYYAASVTAEEELYIGDGGQGDKDSAGRLLRDLKAGEIWYIQVSGNPASDAKPYTIQVTQPAAPKNMSLRFEVGYSGNVNVRPVFVPENAFDPIVSCTVSDPEILEDGPRNICPTYASHRIVKPGEVAVTVTTESGLKATETITVSRLGANVSWLLEEDVLTVFGWNFMQADKSDLWKEVLKKTRVVRFEGGITDLPVEGFASSSIKEVHLPASMKDIRCCFLLCENLEKITLQEPNYSYNVVDGVLFNEDETSLLLYPAKKSGSSYAIPEGVTHIEFSALQNAVNLETVTIPDSVAFIQSKAFEGCTGLKEIVIPASVTDMGENVFHGCSSLQSVTVAGNPNLYWGVFSDCTALKEITFQGDAPTFGDETFRNVTATAYYPAGNATWTDDVMQDYKGDITWKPYCPNAHSFGQWVTQGSESSRVCTICGYTEYKMVTDGGDVEIGAPEQPNLDFDVDHVEPSDQKYVLVEEAVNEAGDAEREVLKVFDITLKNGDGYHVQPDGSVKVKLPLDWDKEGNYKVYRVNDDKSLTDMSAYRQGSHMVFETDHFSLYIIVEEASAAMGDLNLDGEVDASDLTLLARHVAKIEFVQGAALTNADVDSDGDVDAEDLTVHARYVAKIITQWP